MHLARVIGGTLAAGSDARNARWVASDELATLPLTDGLVAVPLAEIVELTLQEETLQVDGSFALLRTGAIRFSVEKASNTSPSAWKTSKKPWRNSKPRACA